MARLTEVVNIRTDCWDVMIDRGSPYGNPFAIGKGHTREEAIAKFREWVQTQPVLIARARRELQGRRLGCHCKPLACHGDVWVELIDAD